MRTLFLLVCLSLRSLLFFFSGERGRSIYFEGMAILVPSATRLKMSLSSSSGRIKKFEFFHWLRKNECAEEIKMTKVYALNFTSGPHAAGEPAELKNVCA